MKSVSLIHTSWLKPFAEYFAKRGADLRLYFADAKIEAKQVTSGEGWITKQQLYRFLNAVAEGENMPELGFVVGDTITPDSLGAIGEAMKAAKTLGDAIRIFCQLINRHSEGNRAWLTEDGGGTVWLLDETRNSFSADRAIADHAGLMSMINLVRLAGSQDWYPLDASLQTGSTTAYRKVPGLRDTAFRFDCSAIGVAFPAQWLLRPIQVGPVGRSVNKAKDDGLLKPNESIAEKLKRLLQEIIGVGGIGPTVNLMSELCGTSPRTLHRQLQESGVSYQKLLDQTRLEQARIQLRDSDVSVKELAYDLGYSGPNNFIRAFRRLTGITPTTFRTVERAK